MILDTNALSAAAEGNPKILSILTAAHQLVLPVIVIGEYRHGIAESRRSAHYRQWLEEMIADCDVLDVTEPTTHHYGAIATELRRAGKPIPTNDIWIAALCRQHNLPILTADRHFDFVQGINCIPW